MKKALSLSLALIMAAVPAGACLAESDVPVASVDEDTFEARINGKIEEAAAAAGEAADSAAGKIEEAADAVIEAVGEAVDAAGEALSAADEKTDEAAEDAEAIAGEILGAIADTAAQIFDGSADEYEYEDIFSEWNPEAPALNTLIDYVEDVTDITSDDFIPVEDRIAVFDMDGTLCGELMPTYLEYYMLAWRILKDPSFTPDEEMLEVARTIRDHALDKSFPEDMPMQHATQAARAYAGMTPDEFADFTTEILLRDVDGFEGMTYGEILYLPMLEVIDYLTENDFKVYIVSGSDRFICRTLFEGFTEIPEENIIGMDVALVASGQNGKDGLDYVFSPEDELVRSDELLIKTLKMNKVAMIAKEIGRQPVLSFGNTSGDTSMHNYTISNNPYKSAAFMLIADDEERDYGNTEKAEELRKEWEESGYNVISMKDDFRTIYGDDVLKTGEFHWLEELDEAIDHAQADNAA